MAKGACVLAALLLITQAGCSADEKKVEAPKSPLDADWLDGQATIGVAHLDRALQLASSDPDAQALVIEARTKLGKGDPATFAQRFSTCAPTLTIEGGFTAAAASDVWMPKTVEELAAGKLAAETERKLVEMEKAATFAARRVDHPDFVLLERTMLPEICIAPRLSVADAYEAIVHELYHAVRRDPRAARNLAGTAPDEKAFQVAFAQVPGGEVEAYLASTRARMRLGHPGKRTAPVAAVLDARTGKPTVPQAQLADIVLRPKPNGLGYSQGLFRGVYADAHKTLLDQLSAKRTALETAQNERRTKIESLRKNIEIQTQNIEVHRHNLGLDTAKADKALAEKARTGIAEAERELASQKKLMDVARESEKRLGVELAAVTAQIDGLSRR